MAENLKSIYKTLNKDSFPLKMELAFYDDENTRQTLFYEKVTWDIGGEQKGLRYGENPCQQAALYKLVNGNLSLADVETILPGSYLASEAELLQSGKHPGKINITDIDAALNILRYFSASPCAVIIKHNNPCGVAKDSTLAKAYQRALMADRVAAFGGAIALNREVDLETAELITASYCEVVAAPGFAPGVMELFAKKKNLRVMRIRAMDRLQDYINQAFVDFKSLIDGGLIAQLSYRPRALKRSDFLPAKCEYKGKTYQVDRQPSTQELDDMLFGWLVEAGITSNSVIYVKNGATVGIGTGEQDRVGVAGIARDKAYLKRMDALCWERYQSPFNLLDDEDKIGELQAEVKKEQGGLKGSVMISDAFFPFRDGIDVGLKEGVSAVLQPGGSIRDFESIEACNEFNAAMMFTGQRSFKH